MAPGGACPRGACALFANVEGRGDEREVRREKEVRRVAVFRGKGASPRHALLRPPLEEEPEST